MDETDYFLREFVKARNRSHLTKVKLKKVVSDILLAQKVRRFLVNVRADSQQKTLRPEITTIRRRLSVRVVSPRGLRSPKHNACRRNTINKTNTAMPDIQKLVHNAGEKIERAPRSASKTPVPNILVSSAGKGARKSSGAVKIVYPSLLDQRNGSGSMPDAPQKSSSAKMPRIENKSANGTVRSSSKSLSPTKSNKSPIIRGTFMDKLQGKTSASKTTSLPALPDTIWAGDPKAIGSVRRPRKNAREMLASYKSGEESRRLLRQMTVPCTRNCHKPDLFSDIERMYTELPSLLPAIEKAREDLASENENYSAHLRSSRDHKPSISLFSLHSQSTSRRNSVAASHISGRRNSVQFQQTTVRHHGSALRQLTPGVGIRH